MKNGYEIAWSDFALNELQKTFKYLEETWTNKELRALASRLESTLMLISNTPLIYQTSDIKKDLRRAVILKHNTLYYRIKNDKIEVISFFSNRQNPGRRKLK